MIRTMTRAALASALMLAMLAIFSRQAVAQAPIPNACCTYTVDVAGFAATCFPVKLTTRWSGTLESVAIFGNGVTVQNITGVPCPPPPALFAWASLDGGATQAWFNFPMNFKVNGCCFTLRIGVDAAGCIIVYMRPC